MDSDVSTYSPPGRDAVPTDNLTGDKPLVERDLRPLARRYLGTEMGDRYVDETRNLSMHADNVLIRVRPQRWLTTDYSKAQGY